MTDDEVTLGEVKRNLDAFRADVDRRFVSLENKLASRDFVLQAVYDRDKIESDRRILQLEDDKRFIFRALFTVVAAFVIESVFIAVSLGGGM
jgi:hypothetical protein